MGGDIANVILNHVDAWLILPVKEQLGGIAHQQKEFVGRIVQQGFDQVMADATTGSRDKNSLRLITFRRLIQFRHRTARE
jgi:hypothetical protein